ncbi:UNVERIFIED_CONTAM: hypothetical protein PYX00_011810 [Menopon gallinae]|uniref:Homologous-pairing protein 2 winged helix domain-containing protein n=1 Tax=Menopon gallinae TaxID=328185 RepID=A0AAW2H8C1_9NEOP
MLHNDPELYSEFSSDENTETQTGGAETESEELQTEENHSENTCSETPPRSERNVSSGSLSKRRNASRSTSARKKDVLQDTPPKKARASVAAKKRASTRKTSAKEKDKQTKLAKSDDALGCKILNYMKSANRPFVRVLGRLVEEKSIYCKLYGKSSVYCVVQAQESADDDVISSMDREIEEARAEIGRLKKEAEGLAGLLSAVNEYPSDDVLRDEIRAFEEEIARCRERLSSFGKDAVDVDEMKKVDGHIKALEAEAKSRRISLRAIVDSLCEGTGMRKKELLSEIGIE